MFGDILVGLHVWPTKSLKEVVEVLERDDLADLNPLKFYVVHRKQQYPDGGVGDVVVTGRISVSLDEQPRQRSSATDRYSTPTPATGSQPSSPSAYSNFASQPVVAQDTAQPPAAGANPYSASTPTDKPILRYDGKSFDEWRTAWKTELSTEKRLEVVKALAAFGASGQGPAATEAILGVVEQLQWQNIGGQSAADKLKSACVDAFTTGDSTGGYRIPATEWLPPVVEKLKAGSPSMRRFGNYIFAGIPAGDTSIIPQLLALSRQAEMQDYAFLGLKAVDPKLENKEVLARFQQSLHEKGHSAEFEAQQIHYFRYPEYPQGGQPPFTALRFVPELELALFNPSENVKKSARLAITSVQSADAKPLVDRLIHRLDDQSRSDRLAVIRALAAIGPLALSAEDRLRKIAHSETDADRYAAAVALERISQDTDRDYNSLLGINAQSTDVSPHERRLDAERKEIFPNGVYSPRDLILGGGGGFF